MRHAAWFPAPLLLAAISATQARAGTDCTMRLVASLPMTVLPNGAGLLVSARLDGHPLKLLVDTGSEIITLSEDAVPSLATLHEHAMASGFGGGAATQSGKVHGLTLGPLHADVEAMVVTKNFLGFDGTLGMSVLGAYDVDFDVPGRELRLFSPVGDCVTPTAFLTGPLYPVPELTDGKTEARLQPRLTVTLDGKDFPALLDTGSTISSLSPSAVQTLGLQATRFAADKKISAEGIGGMVQTPVHQFGEIDVGPVGIQNPHLALQPHAVGDSFQVIIGMNFLLNTHLWLSNSTHTVILQAPPVASPPITGK